MVKFEIKFQRNQAVFSEEDFIYLDINDFLTGLHNYMRSIALS